MLFTTSFNYWPAEESGKYLYTFRHTCPSRYTIMTGNHQFYIIHSPSITQLRIITNNPYIRIIIVISVTIT